MVQSIFRIASGCLDRNELKYLGKPPRRMWVRRFSEILTSERVNMSEMEFHQSC